MSNLQELPTWQIQDASKIQAYMTCPRKYFYEHVLGWRSTLPNVHLEAGTGIHLSLEHLYTHGFDSVQDAFLLFFAHYRKHFTPDMDEGNSPKNPACVERALFQYVEVYDKDLSIFQVLHTEVAGSVAISSTRLLYFKIDTICRGPEGYFCLEHKTGSRYSNPWAAQWRMKFQVGVYSHVLHCMYPPTEVWGVKINGIFLAPIPKLRRDGVPYAGARDCEFHRIPIRRNLPSMEAWLEEALYWSSRIEDDFSRLASAKEGDSCLGCFRRNTESCTQYGACPFLDYCSVWHNPLQHVDGKPVEFEVRPWDPRSIEYVTKVVEL